MVLTVVIKGVQAGVKSILPQFNNGIASLCAMTPGGLKTAGIDHEGFANPMTAWDVSVTINNAICLWKLCGHAIFDVKPAARSVTDAEGISVDLEQAVLWQLLAGTGIAHVAVYGVDSPVVKAGKHGEVCNVSCMDDDLTFGKCQFDPLPEIMVRCHQMGIGKDAEKGHWLNLGGLLATNMENSGSSWPVRLLNHGWVGVARFTAHYTRQGWK